MPGKEIIEKHLQSYISDLENLEKNKPVSLEELKADKDLLWILERGLYMLIQNLLDMMAHIVSSNFNKPRDFYSDLGEILESESIKSLEEKVLLN